MTDEELRQKNAEQIVPYMSKIEKAGLLWFADGQFTNPRHMVGQYIVPGTLVTLDYAQELFRFLRKDGLVYKTYGMDEDGYLWGSGHLLSPFGEAVFKILYPKWPPEPEQSYSDIGPSAGVSP